ncbi:MAG: hypothetical protein ACC618_03065 [Patescibacteria group bacterium]
MGIPENWRNQPQRLKFTGFKRETENGTEVSFSGTNWVPSENGFHREENPLQGREIYKAPAPSSENGKTPRQIHGTVEISASSG